MDSTLVGKAVSVFYVQSEGGNWERNTRVRGSTNNDGVAPANGKHICKLLDLCLANIASAAVILHEDGDWIANQTEAGHSVTLEFEYSHVAVGVNSFDGGRPSYFTSSGPTLDGRMKPEISAPGGFILSTWPVSKGSWAVLSGTSMSTPYVAGVGALFFGARGGRSSISGNGAHIAYERIVASGGEVLHEDGSNNLAPVSQVGAGLVNAEKVVLFDTQVSPGNINLNDTAHFNGSQSIVVENTGSDSVTYHVSHSAGTTIMTRANADLWVSLDPIYSSEDDDVAKVSISSTNVTIEAGSSATISLEFAEPSRPDNNTLPVYGGRINIVGSNGEAIAVTYMGKNFRVLLMDIG